MPIYESPYQAKNKFWAALAACLPPDQLEGFYRGNALQALLRYDRADGVDDLREARRYLDQLIEHALEHAP